MQQAGIYARYSTAEQRATSLDDQIRRCKEKAAALGYEVADEHIFVDAAVSGSAKELAKREGYQALLRACEAGEVQAVIATEVSRLARSQQGTIALRALVEQTQIRLLTVTDGVDSSQKGWRLAFGLNGVIAENFLEETKERVIAGMLGQLTRGFQIGAPPFGYRGEKRFDARGEHIGTHWRIEEGEAAIVRSIFDMRLKGLSYCRIADSLNRRNIKTPRPPREKDARSYWRPSTVRQLIANPIFGGRFLWNSSAFSRAKAKREKRRLEPVEFARPELALVSFEVWSRCNSTGKVSAIRGGRRHPLSGLARCGECNARLSIGSGGTTSRTLYCAQCEQQHRVGVRELWMGYASVTGLRHALEFVLERLCTPAVRQELNARLQRKLEGGNSEELQTLKGELDKATRAWERSVRYMREVDDDYEVLRRECEIARSEKRKLEDRLSALKKGLATVDKRALRTQIEVDPVPLIRSLLEPGEGASGTQPVLARLLPKIRFIDRPVRHSAVYEISVVPGVAVAEASKTAVADDEVTVLRVRVTCDPRPPRAWRAALEPEK